MGSVGGRGVGAHLGEPRELIRNLLLSDDDGEGAAADVQDGLEHLQEAQLAVHRLACESARSQAGVGEGGYDFV